jgi:8-oxo-dGTP diphosphatase
MFDLPGGKVENGESPESAIVREIREELGITVRPIELLPVLKRSAWDYGKGVRHWVLATYRCEITEGTVQESDALRWVLIPEVSEANTLKADLELIQGWACEPVLLPKSEPEVKP